MYYDPAGFPFVAGLQGDWALMRQEMLELDAPVLDFHRLGPLEEQAEQLLRDNGWTPSWQIDSTDPNPAWLTYGLSYHGLLPDDLPDRMPFTSRLLSRLEGCEVSALSLMRGNSFIKPHAHPELAGRLLTLHITLEAQPGRSFLTVGDQVREERNGRAVVFDGSVTHHAVNMSDYDRTILYLEFDPARARLQE